QTPIGFVALVIVPATIIIWEELKLIGAEVASFAKSKKKNAAVLVFFVVLGLTGSTYAQLADTEVSAKNTLAASNDFGTIVPLYQSNSYTCASGATTTIDQFGTVSINPGNSRLFLTVNLEDATPNATYDIWINQNPGACPLSSPSFSTAMSTDSNGNATKTFQYDKNSSATSFWISAVGGGQVLRSLAVN
ncbi:hypothetical protein KC573_04060, partial [candidate division WWE3 bacterium]|nr:hypothetical protein [candidate division WWE3 bacterium]